MNKSLTILFYTVDHDSHLNAFIGLAERVRSRGHTIVFLTIEEFREKLINYGFGVELIGDNKQYFDCDSDDSLPTNEAHFNVMMSDNSLDKRIEVMTIALKKTVFIEKQREPFMKSIMDRYPHADVIVMDSWMKSPPLMFSGKPWVSVCPFNPLILIRDDKLPPHVSGYSSNADYREWTDVKAEIDRVSDEHNDELNQWFSKNGYPTLSNRTLANVSPYLNLYNCPLELDYTDLVHYPPNYYSVDNLMRTESGTFELPQQLRNACGKLIYFSVGTLLSLKLDLMTRLLSILSQSKHRFIVSKGPLHNQLELSANMWGAESLPQTLVLPLVDLVITHGGNNTVTEAFAFGKPMIVMPVFGDQFDNAQRIVDKGFGVRLNPHSCTEHELLAAIDRLLNDETLRDKLKAISRRIQTDKRLEKAAESIERLAL